MAVRFCTTCGRTYADPDIEMCPHDGTPLFGMAGESDEEQATGLDASPEFEISESNPLAELSAFQSEGVDEPNSDDAVSISGESSDADLFGLDDDLPSPVRHADEDDAFDVGQSFEEDDLPAPIVVDDYDDLPVAAAVSGGIDDEEVDLFGEEDAFDDPAILMDSSADDLPASVPTTTADLFADSEPEDDDISLIMGDSDAFDLGSESSSPDMNSALPMADDAASVQIAADIMSTLGELGADDRPDSGEYMAPAASASLVDTLDVEDNLSYDSPETELPVIDEPKKPSMVGKIVLLLILVVAVVCAVMFLWYLPGQEKLEKQKLEKQRQELLKKKVPAKVVTPVVTPPVVPVENPADAKPTTPTDTNNKTPAITTPAVKTPAAKTPAVKTPAVKTPAVKTPAVKKIEKVETPIVKKIKKVVKTPVVKQIKKVVKTPAVVTPPPVKPDAKKKLDGELDKMMN